MPARTKPRLRVARQARGPVRHLRFPGTGLSIRLRNALPVQRALREVLRGWQPQDLPAPRPGDMRSFLSSGQTGYTARSPLYDGALTGLDTAGATCALIADLSESFLAQRPGCLALHCGAFRFEGDLIMLTGPTRAGKSTLVGRLTAEPDVTVFCDDVLPLTEDFQAMSLGVAPRLRLPLPATASARFRAHVAQTPGARDRSYAYLAAKAVAPHGTLARPGTLIVLDRRADGPAALHRMNPDEAVHHLLAQNMGNLGTAEAAFEASRHLAAQVACLRLVYSELEDAVTLLRRAFAPDAPPQTNVPLLQPLPEPLHAPELQSKPVPSDRVLRQAEGVVLRRMGAGAFLWRPADAMVWHLNPVGHAVWTMLEIPGCATDLAETLTEIFPDVPFAQLTADIAALMGDLEAEGFLTHGSGQ